MGTRLRYNGIDLPYIRTQSVDQESFRDESGSDVMYWKFTIKVSTLWRVGEDEFDNNNAGPGPMSQGGERNVAAIAKQVRHMLLTPRRGLQYEAGGEVLIRVPDNDQSAGTSQETLDARNGPNPLYCNIRQVTDATFLIDYAIETWIVDCGDGPPEDFSVFTPTIETLLALPKNRRPWTSNRWSDSVHIDETGRTQWTRRGVLTTRSDMGLSPDQLRGVIFPKIAKGFQRVRSVYTLRADGLYVDYEFQDQEFYLAPPFPAHTAKGTYTESASEDGRRFGEVLCELRGSKQCNKIDLLTTAMAVCMGKISTGLSRTAKGTWLGSVSVSEELYDPIVSVRIRAMLRETPNRTKGTAFALGNFQLKPLSGWKNLGGEFDDQQGPDMSWRGTAGLLLIAAVLHDPCLDATVRRFGTVDEPPVDEQSEFGGDAGGDFGDASVTQGGQPYPEAEVTIATPPPGAQTAPDPNSFGDDAGDDFPLDDDEGNYADEEDYDADGNLLSTPVELTGVYEQFWCRKHHKQIENNVVITIAKTGEPRRKIQLAPPQHSLTVEWFAEKLGAAPQVPDPVQDGENLVLMEWEIEPVSVELAADGESLRYTVSGRYAYEFLEWEDAALNAALPPWMRNDQPEDFRTPLLTTPDIIFPPGAGGGLDIDQGLTAGDLFPPEE